MIDWLLSFVWVALAVTVGVVLGLQINAWIVTAVLR